MFRGFYATTRDAVEGARDVSETLWHDWPIMALGLIIRNRGSLEDYPELEQSRDRETKRLHREYLRRRWQGGRPEAKTWYLSRLDDLEGQLSRRRRELSREAFSQTVERHKDNVLFVVQDRRDAGGD